MADTFSPPASVRAAAKRALEWIADGKAGSGFTDVGRARAGQLANGQSVSADTIKRMVSFFARHETDKKAEGFTQGEKGFPSAGRVAWDAWGGDAGQSWANGIARTLDNKEKSFMTNLTQSYARIIKADKNDDGTMTVYGKATDDSIDMDAQICDNDWLKSAMPDWMQAGGNVREQHSSIAAGVATEYEMKDDGHYIRALVVDPSSVKKVEHGVLKGFSIGIRNPQIIRDSEAKNGRIVGGTIVEVSLVDRPANPNAKLMLAKADDLGKLTAVSVEVPKPSDLFKSEETVETVVESVEPEIVEAEIVEEVAVIEETAVESVEEVVADEVTPEAEIVEAAKSLLATVNKFDQATYDAAIAAISDLIIIEAGEMKAGSDERDSIKDLLGATKRLYCWYNGEVENGEVANPNPAITGAESDSMMYTDEDDSSVEAVYMGEKSAEISTLSVDEIVAKAVDAAKQAVTGDVELLKADLVSEKEKSAQLETDLDAALSKAAAGGPVRAGFAKPAEVVNDFLEKAARYEALAKSTSDATLATGYRQLARDLKNKSKKED